MSKKYWLSHFFGRQYQRLHREVHSETAATYSQFISYSEERLKNNPRRFWEFVSLHRDLLSLPSIMEFRRWSLTDLLQIIEGHVEFLSRTYRLVSDLHNNNAHLPVTNSLTSIPETDPLSVIRATYLCQINF